MPHIHESARQTPVCHECDLCIIGGSSTGVFAAIAAARLGLRVALVEALGCFGGTATASLVNVWHSKFDEVGQKQIFAGLVTETMDRLQRRDAVQVRGHNPAWHWAFAPAELAIELDEMVGEQPGIRPFLHTRFVTPVLDQPGRVSAAIIEDKTGRRAIRASFFIDASGDGDLVHRAGFETYRRDHVQPPTTPCVVTGFGDSWIGDPAIKDVIFNPAVEGSLPPGFLWSAPLPGENARMIAGTRVHGIDCSDADALTRAEIEGRRQVRRMLDLVRQHVPGGAGLRLTALPARLGLRESRHARCLHQLTEQQVLRGVRFPDAIANGSYRVDVHSADSDGLVFRYLDGREIHCSMVSPYRETRWAKEGEATATFYQVPLGSLIPQGAQNVLVAGRCLDADEGAFGAVRVMVNTSQMGQAAGVAAWSALDQGVAATVIDAERVRTYLARQGAIII